MQRTMNPAMLVIICPSGPVIYEKTGKHEVKAVIYRAENDNGPLIHGTLTCPIYIQ